MYIVHYTGLRVLISSTDSWAVGVVRSSLQTAHCCSSGNQNIPNDIWHGEHHGWLSSSSSQWTSLLKGFLFVWQLPHSFHWDEKGNELTRHCTMLPPVEKPALHFMFTSWMVWWLWMGCFVWVLWGFFFCFFSAAARTDNNLITRRGFDTHWDVV